MQKTIRLWRLILASILGAVMACLLVLFHVHRNLLLLVLSYFFVSVFLVRFAFGKMTTARTVMHLLLYYACAFILAGLLLQVQKSFHYPLTGASMLGLMLFVLFLFRYFMPKLKKEKERVSYLYRMRIYDGEIKSKEWHFWIPEMDFTMQSAKSRLCSAVKNFWKNCGREKTLR